MTTLFIILPKFLKSLPPANEGRGNVSTRIYVILFKISLPVWLTGTMFLLGESVSYTMFLLGVSVQDGSLSSKSLLREGGLSRGVSVREGVSVRGVPQTKTSLQSQAGSTILLECYPVVINIKTITSPKLWRHH